MKSHIQRITQLADRLASRAFAGRISPSSNRATVLVIRHVSAELRAIGRDRPSLLRMLDKVDAVLAKESA